MYNFKKIILIIIALLFLILLGLGIYFYLLRTQYLPIIQPKELITHGHCLSDDEFADYPIDEKYAKEIKVPKIPLIISVRDKDTGKEKFNFQIDNIEPQGLRPQLHRCGVYVIRKFNYDSRKTKQDSGFRAELWKYQYDGTTNRLLLLREKDDKEVYKNYYSYNLSIDPNEIYFALERGYSGQADHSFVIKDLKTKEDIFVLLVRDMIDRYPFLENSDIGLTEWTKNGNYVWGVSFVGTYILGFFRIDTLNWNLEVFELPDTELHKGVLGGDALNIERGYVTQHPDYIWIGIQEHYEQIKQEWQEQGKISSLYLYNLFTKEQTPLATTTEPLWFFKPKWLSDTELEYYIPSGERKTYKLNE
jgi:hypothetical protein